ncbi:hypothetical protein X275_00720 [Marinitoga sp. 1197]|uniref:ABC transporter substrate-binding protein n=1 Tax=Marinitoga sp. 1197 TaxID=1428449 RepID=UPI000640EC22|nr:ABC transporter substrate-binding protein [Marinitoga sp. 1197]KLO24240.1 hypothetical protein X275_00720 [Marinitoga sp. 1197]
MKKNKFILLIVILILFNLNINGKILKYAEVSRPQYFAPYLSDDILTLRILDLIYAPMFRIFNVETAGDITTPVKKVFANEYNTSPYRTTVTLKNNIKWSDNHRRELTSKDIEFTFNLINSDYINTSYKYITSIISKIKTMSKKSLSVDYKVYTKYKLSVLDFPIVSYRTYLSPKNYFKKVEKGDLNFNGPYILEKTFKRDSIYFKRNVNYPDPPEIDGVKISISPSYENIEKGVISGLYELITDVPPEKAYRNFKGDKRFNIYPSFENKFYYISLNYNKNIEFKNKNFRRALIYGINREGILDSVYLGGGKVISGPFNPTFFGYDNQIIPYEYDQKKAIEYLKDVKFKKKFIFIQPQGNKELDNVVFSIQQNLKKINIILDVKKYSWSEYLNKLKNGEYDMAIVEYSSAKTLTSISPLLLPDGYLNFGKYNSKEQNEKLYNLIKEVEGPSSFELDPIVITTKYKNIHKILHEEIPYIWLFTLQKSLVISKIYDFDFIVPSRPFMNIDEWRVINEN